jgi:hypothetical protein
MYIGIGINVRNLEQHKTARNSARLFTTNENKIKDPGSMLMIEEESINLWRDVFIIAPTYRTPRSDLTMHPYIQSSSKLHAAFLSAMVPPIIAHSSVIWAK